MRPASARGRRWPAGQKDYETILYEVDRGRARITLNRPDKRNAISMRMQQELEHALWWADEDNRVHGVILRGTASFDDDAWRLERAQRCRMALFDMHEPAIAQVHGRCLAGGTDLGLKSVPPERLQAEVESLADRFALIDTDLLSANKRIVNLGLELMGARTLQRLAAEMDARGHLAKSRDAYREVAMKQGLREAIRWRDGPFGDDLVKR